MRKAVKVGRSSLRKVKVGVSASLDPARTVHTQGFLDSVDLFNQTYMFPLHLIWTDDGANASSATQAARRMVSSGVDIVVGHFASDAASAALAFYQDTDTPVLLPAATLPQLTDYGHAYRVCQPDNKLVEYLVDAVKSEGYEDIYVEHDGSEQGYYLADTLSKKFVGAPAENFRDVKAVVYCGRYESAKTFLLRSEMRSDKRDVWLTDDALCDPLLKLAKDLSMRIRVISYQPAKERVGGSLAGTYRQQYGTQPGPYFPATLASLEICLALDADENIANALDKRAFNTTFGTIAFSGGESDFGNYQIFDLNRAKFHE